MNRFTPFIEPQEDRFAFCDGLVCGVTIAAVIFAGGYAGLLWLLS